MWVSTALTSQAHRRCTPQKNRRIPTICAGRFDAGHVHVSAVNTGPRRSESAGILVAQPGACATDPPPPPAPCLRGGPVVMVRRRLCLESRLESDYSTRVGIY